MKNRRVAGLIPCGGRAARIAPLPCSKEVLPVGLRTREDGSIRVMVVSHCLLDQMRQGGVRTAYFILRKGKWDIPEYFGDGRCIGLDLAYLMVGRPDGPAFTLNQAYAFVRDSHVAFGFPDILFEPRDAFERAFERLHASRAAVVLVLCRVPDPSVHDMIRVDPGGRVIELLIKPRSTDLQLGWVLAVWTAEFTEFMNHFLSVGARAPQSSDTEVTVGEVIRAGIHEGLVTQAVAFPEHTYLDIGTPDGLRQVFARPPTFSAGSPFLQP